MYNEWKSDIALKWLLQPAVHSAWRDFIKKSQGIKNIISVRSNVLCEQLIKLKNYLFGAYNLFLTSRIFLDSLIINPTHFTFIFINKEQGYCWANPFVKRTKCEKLLQVSKQEACLSPKAASQSQKTENTMYDV